jgi:hypothetical protein
MEVLDNTAGATVGFCTSELEMLGRKYSNMFGIVERDVFRLTTLSVDKIV